MALSRTGTFTAYHFVPSFIDLTSFDLKLSGDGAATISCGKRFHVLMVRGRNECRY